MAGEVTRPHCGIDALPRSGPDTTVRAFLEDMDRIMFGRDTAYDLMTMIWRLHDAANAPTVSIRQRNELVSGLWECEGVIVHLFATASDRTIARLAVSALGRLILRWAGTPYPLRTPCDDRDDEAYVLWLRNAAYNIAIVEGIVDRARQRRVEASAGDIFRSSRP